MKRIIGVEFAILVVLGVVMGVATTPRRQNHPCRSKRRNPDRPVPTIISNIVFGSYGTIKEEGNGEWSSFSDIS